MKKVIFIVCMLGLLWGCKKEKVEPVEVGNETNKQSQVGPYHQPSKIEMFDSNSNVIRILYLTYNSDGLVKTVELGDSIVTRKRNIYFKRGLKDFIYHDGQLMTETTSNILDSGIIESSQVKNYTYENNFIKTFQNNITSQNPRQTYYYDKSGKINYSLTDLLGLTKDSIAYTYYINDRIMGYNKLAFLAKGEPIRIGTGLSGYGYETLHSDSIYIDKKLRLIKLGYHDPYGGYNSWSYTISNIPNKFQKSVYQEIRTLLNITFEESFGVDFNFEAEKLIFDNNFNFHILGSDHSWGNKTAFNYLLDNDNKVVKIEDAFNGKTVKLFY